MENNYTIISKLLFSILAICFVMGFSGDPPNGNTGAPGDALCTTSCHSSPGSQTGSIAINGLTDDPLIGNKTYNLSITILLSTGAASRTGFQLVALDGNTDISPSTGAFSNLGSNVGATTSGNRVYLEHSPTKNFSGSIVTYTADWTAPQSTQNRVSFYAAGILALGGDESDDVLVTTSIQNLAGPVDEVFEDGFEN